MKSELLLLGAAGAVIVLLVIYMTMDDRTPEAPVKRPREGQTQEQKVKKVKEAVKEKDEAVDALKVAKENLKEIQKAAEFAKKIDSSGAAAVVAANTEKVLAKLESADEAIQGMDPAVKEMAMTVATTAGTWLSDPDNRAWAYDTGKSLWGSFWETPESFYQKLDLPEGHPDRPTKAPWWLG
jgi:hypothetical protein